MRRFVAIALVFSAHALLTACSGTDGASIDPGTGDDGGALAPVDPSTPAAPHGDANGGGASAPANLGDDDAATATDDAGLNDASAHADASNPGDAGAPHDASAHDAAPSDIVNGCTAALFAQNDQSFPVMARDITFPNGGDPKAYTPPCMRIARGQAVTWRGRFNLFPLEASGGAKASPIPTTDTGRALTVTFPTAGTYGFASSAAPTVMLGAIDVKP